MSDNFRREELRRISVEAFGLEEKFPDAIFVETWHSDSEVQTKWQRYGFVAIMPLRPTGLVLSENGQPLGINLVDTNTPFGLAMNAIDEATNAGEVASDGKYRAMQELFNGTFEQSQWVRFLPGQTD